LKDLFQRCRHQEFLVFSIDSDLSFPPSEQAKLVQVLKRVRVPVMWITVHSDKGHDAFLLEPRLFTPHIHQVLNHVGPAEAQECQVPGLEPSGPKP
jgi:homoserine O-acetyltransferase